MFYNNSYVPQSVIIIFIIKKFVTTIVEMFAAVIAIVDRWTFAAQRRKASDITTHRHRRPNTRAQHCRPDTWLQWLGRVQSQLPEGTATGRTRQMRRCSRSPCHLRFVSRLLGRGPSLVRSEGNIASSPMKGLWHWGHESRTQSEHPARTGSEALRTTDRKRSTGNRLLRKLEAGELCDLSK